MGTKETLLCKIAMVVVLKILRHPYRVQCGVLFSPSTLVTFFKLLTLKGF